VVYVGTCCPLNSKALAHAVLTVANEIYFHLIGGTRSGSSA